MSVEWGSDLAEAEADLFTACSRGALLDLTSMLPSGDFGLAALSRMMKIIDASVIRLLPSDMPAPRLGESG